MIRKRLTSLIITLTMVFSFLIPITTVFALTPDEIIEREAPNGVITFSSLRPKDYKEAEFMALSDWYFRDSADSYGNYKVGFEWKLIGQDDEGEYLYSLDEGIITVYDDTNGYDVKKTKNVKVNYLEGNKKVLAEVKESMKVFDKIIIEEDDYVRNGYRINDLALINFYYYNKKEDVERDNKLGSIIKYSPGFIKDTEGKNFKYTIDCRAGDGTSLELWEICFGGLAVYHDNIAYAMHDIGEVEEHTVFVDNSVEDTPEATIKAIKDRVKKYIGVDIEIKYQGTIDELRQKVYNDAVLEFNEALSNGIHYGSDTTTADSFAQDAVDHLFYDDIRKESETDGRYYKTTLNGTDIYFLVVRTDISKVEIPSFLGKDILTDISVSAGTTSIPLDTSVSAKELTDGDEYNKIKKALGNNANFKTYDIKLFSDNSNSYITKLNDDEFEVRMPIPEGFKGKQVKVYYVDSKGNIEDHIAKVDGEYLVFKTNHFSAYSIVNLDQNEEVVEEIKDDIKNPQTYDGLMNWIVLSIISAIGIVGIITYRKKQNI